MSPMGRGSILRRLREIEEAASRFYRKMRLEDGTVVSYLPDEALDALRASIDEEDHWLLPHIRREVLLEDAEEGRFPGDLIRAIERSRERIRRAELEGAEEEAEEDRRRRRRL